MVIFISRLRFRITVTRYLPPLFVVKLHTGFSCRPFDISCRSGSLSVFAVISLADSKGLAIWPAYKPFSGA